jgi:hypothetical protein
MLVEDVGEPIENTTSGNKDKKEKEGEENE